MIKKFPVHKLICIFILPALFTTRSFSQAPLNVGYGNLKTNRLTVDEFKNEHGLKVSAGYVIDSATAFFSIPGLPYINAVNYFPFFDTAQFGKYQALLYPGAVVSFAVKLSDKNNRHFSKDISYVFYSMNTVNTAIAYPGTDSASISFKKNTNLNYISGTIYFSGYSFPNVVTFPVGSKLLPDLKLLLQRCAPGSKITFDNVSYKDEDGSIKVLNKTIEL